MPAPSIPVFNGQIKTPWRGGYTSLEQLTEYSRECSEEMAECRPYRLIWKSDSLMPFQFYRAFSMSTVTFWGLYNSDGSLYRDLSPEISKLGYYATNLDGGAAVQNVYYIGTPLAAALDPGTYYMRIVTGGVTYYWEPILIVCESYGENAFPDDSFDGLESDVNPDADWSVFEYENTAIASTNTPGAPSNPAWEVEGNYVINIGDDSVYQYTSGNWVQDPTPATGAWYDYSTGNWYRFLAGNWVGIIDPVALADGQACWAGTFDIPIGFDLSDMPCLDSDIRYQITVSGVESGSLLVEVGSESVSITEDGTYTLTAETDDGDTLILTPSGFEGCVTSIQANCLADMDDCFFRLDWGNCGNVGNTYLSGGFTNSVYFDRHVYPIRPQPETTIESKQRADGSVVQTTRRRETTWELRLGMLPWYVADALAELPMYDTVELRPVGGGSDVLTALGVSVENEDDFAECWKTVVISFQIDSASVACCDLFLPPCKEACVSAEGYTDDADPVTDSVYLVNNASAYATATGGGFGAQSACASGIASITFHDDFVRTVYFDLNTGAWADLCDIDTITPTETEDDCLLNVLAIIPSGYSAVLQYMNLDGDWITDDNYDLSAEEWADNDIQRETPVDQDPANGMRLMVYIDGIDESGDPIAGRCVVGYSAEFTYDCA